MTAKQLTEKYGVKNMNGQGLNSVCLKPSSQGLLIVIIAKSALFVFLLIKEPIHEIFAKKY